MLLILDRKSEAAVCYQRARDVGVAHGLYSVECTACMGLGVVAINAGRDEEGQDLLRNALVAAQLNDLDDDSFILVALDALIQSLFKTHAIDEVEPLVVRYREAARVNSDKKGGFCRQELEYLVCSARLHEVLSICTPCWEPLHTAQPLPPARPNSVPLSQVAPRPREARRTC